MNTWGPGWIPWRRKAPRITAVRASPRREPFAADACGAGDQPAGAEGFGAYGFGAYCGGV